MSQELAETGHADEPPLEGGEVRDFEELSFHEAKHRAETARSLATWLVFLLGGSLALHYLLTAVLAFGGKETALEHLSSIFNAWLPAITGLVGAATTYYFTRER